MCLRIVNLDDWDFFNETSLVNNNRGSSLRKLVTFVCHFRGAFLSRLDGNHFEVHMVICRLHRRRYVGVHFLHQTIDLELSAQLQLKVVETRHTIRINRVDKHDVLILVVAWAELYLLAEIDGRLLRLDDRGEEAFVVVVPPFFVEHG